MDYTFCELRSKDVINIVDGKKLGRVADLVMDVKHARICGIILPVSRGFSFFKSCEDLYVPFKDILRIGEDVIMVELFLQTNVKGGKKGGYYHGQEEREEVFEEKEFCAREVKFDQKID